MYPPKIRENEDKEMKEFSFNAELAKANVDKHNREVYNQKMKRATETTERFLETIKRESELGREQVLLQSSLGEDENAIVRNQLRGLDFKVEQKGNRFEISWKREEV